MANGINKVGETKDDKDKAFKGSGVEGTKEGGTPPPVDPPSEPPVDPPVDPPSEPPVDPPVDEKGPSLPALKKELAKCEKEHKKLLAEEDQRGFMDGHLVIARKSRVRRIEDLKGEIENHKK